MRTKTVWIGAVALVAVAGILAFVVLLLIKPDPYGAPELTLPPALLTQEQLGGRQFLFDGQTTKGWQIEGQHQIKDGTLELGGAGPTKATLERTFDSGEKIEFHFFQEGATGAKLWVKPSFIDPKDPWAEYRRDHSADLNLSGYVYKRWHAAKTTLKHERNHIDMEIKFDPIRDDVGNHAHHRTGFPCNEGCRYQVSFEVGPQAKLYLRNVVLWKHAKAE